MYKTPQQPGNWDGFKAALAETDVPSDFLSPEDRQQGVHVRDPLDEALSHSNEFDVVGMAWWNGLSEADRRYWCLAAMTAVPAQAWKYFRLVTAPRKSVRVSGGG